MADFQSPENTDHFPSVTFQASRLQVGVHQPSEDPVDMVLLKLIMLAVRIRQIQARDPVWMKIVNKAADLLCQVGQDSVFSQHFRLEQCNFARMHESCVATGIFINSTKMMCHLSWRLCPVPRTALLPICNIPSVFAPPRRLMSPGSQEQFVGIFLLPTGP